MVVVGPILVSKVAVVVVVVGAVVVAGSSGRVWLEQSRLTRLWFDGLSGCRRSGRVSRLQRSSSEQFMLEWFSAIAILVKVVWFDRSSLHRSMLEQLLIDIQVAVVV